MKLILFLFVFSLFSCLFKKPAAAAKAAAPAKKEEKKPAAEKKAAAPAKAPAAKAAPKKK